MKQEYFEFSNNVKIIAGPGALDSLAPTIALYGGYRIFIVSDKVIEKFGHIETLKKALKGVEELTVGATYLDVPSSLTTKDVENMYIAFRKSGCDAIIGVGGSRVMNAAKALAILVTTRTKNIADFRGIDTATKTNHIAFGLVPTAFGSGGEVSRTVVVIDEEHKTPIEIVSDALQPNFAILDPMFLKTLPDKEVYMGLVDILSYSIESYISARANSLTKSFSKMAMFLVKDNFQKAIIDRDDLSLNNLQKAASISAITYSNTYTGLAHALANTLAATYKIHRAEVLCCIFYNVLQDLKSQCIEQFAQMLLFYRGAKEYAAITDDERADVFLRVISNMIKHMSNNFKVKTKLSDYGVKEEDLAMLADLTIHDGDMIAAPKQYTKEEIIEILRQSL